MVRFGVMGLGFMGRAHLATLAAHDRAEVRAVYDPDPHRLSGPLGPDGGNIDTGAGPWDDSHVRRCGSEQELLSDGEIDAVVVAVPSYLHADSVCAALEAGKHVFCEKPMALTLGDCDRMLASARKARRVLMIGHCIRFWPEYVAAAGAVRSGQFGRLRSLLMSRRGGYPGWGGRNWFRDHTKSGGALLDLHIHDVDYALFVLGRPRAVLARGWVGDSGGIDHVVCWYDYGRDGPIVQMEGSWIQGPSAPFVMEFRMYFERASLSYSNRTGASLEVYDGQGETLEVPQVDGYVAEIDHFIRCVQTGMNSRIVPPESSRLTIELALAEAESIRLGREVALD